MGNSGEMLWNVAPGRSMALAPWSPVQEEIVDHS